MSECERSRSLMIRTNENLTILWSYCRAFSLDNFAFRALSLNHPQLIHVSNQGESSNAEKPRSLMFLAVRAAESVLNKGSFRISNNIIK